MVKRTKTWKWSEESRKHQSERMKKVVHTKRTSINVCIDCNKELNHRKRNCRCLDCHRKSIKRTDEYIRPIIECYCDECGKLLQREPSEYNRNKHHFCNKTCQGLWSKKNQSGKNSWHWIGERHYCKQCNKEVLKPSTSGLCQKCYYENGNYSGENHPAWKGGFVPFVKTIRELKEYRKWRNQVLNRDNNTCQKCFAEDHLEAHHLKEFNQLIREFNITTKEEARMCKELWDINNGKTLCIRCHAEEHPDQRKLILRRIS